MAKRVAKICLITVCFGSLTLANSQCPTFQEILGQSSFRCSKGCSTKAGAAVFGTRFYSPDSPVCAAAAHAGVIFEEGEVRFTLTDSLPNQFIGTVKNRIVSKSRGPHKAELAFQFQSPKWIPQDLNDQSSMSDVVMIHNGYSTELSSRYGIDFWVKCLWEKTVTPVNKSIVRWNFEDIKARNKIFTKDSGFIESHRSGNLRAFNCLGRYPLTDVFGLAVRTKYDKYLASNLTFRGVQEGSLNITFTRYENGRTVFKRRFPDDWNYEPKDYPNEIIPLRFYSLKETDDALYEVRSKGQSTSFRYVKAPFFTHFQVLVRECPEGKYGHNCGQICKDCFNEGICHPLTGTCICKPGTYGETCQKICPLGKFGSNCQFECTDNHLPVPDQKKDCKGLIFCLPRPYGCSCAVGYEGFSCDTLSELDLPRFRNPPRVELGPGSVVIITFAAWNASVDYGHTYGFEIYAYEVQGKYYGLGNGEFQTWGNIDPTKKLEYKTKLSANYIYQFRIAITLGLRTKHKTKHKSSDDLVVLNVSLPCFPPGQMDTRIFQMVNTIEFQHQVPAKQTSFLGCTFTAKENSSYATSRQEKICHNDTLSSWVNCKLQDLPSGQGLNVRIWCENSIGRCQSTNYSTFTLPEISDYLRYSYGEIRIAPFYVFDQETTKLKVLSLNVNFNDSYLEDYDVTDESNRENFQTIATKSNLTFSDEKKVYIFSLEKHLMEEPVKLVVILLYNDAAGERRKSVMSFLSTDTTESGLLVPLLTVGVLVLLLIVILLLRRSRKKFFTHARRKDAPLNVHEQHPSTSISAEQQLSQENYANSRSYDDVLSNKPPEYINISAESSEELEIYLNHLIFSQESDEQFQSVPKHCGKSTMYGSHPMNKLKNRYKNNLPYDETRVVLSKIDNDPHSDYINASYVKGMDQSKCYIASQGPKIGKQSTLNDFWRMVIENNVQIIVMVANFVENGKQKVEPYFDVRETIQIGNFVIYVSESLNQPHFVRSVIQVFDVQSNELITQITHYQFTTWPDHGTPTQIFPLVSMIKSLTEEFKQGTIVIHCSAGLGRTGTVLMILLLKEAYDMNNSFNPIETLKDLRECRPGLVDNIYQYKLALSIFYEMLFGNTDLISVSGFENNFNSYFKEAATLYRRLKKQPIVYTYTFGRNHLHMNRNLSVLPCDTYVVLFDSVSHENNPDYLNAIAIDIEDLVGSIIVTEHPMESTARNFWKMIFAKKCSCLLLLNRIQASKEYPPIITQHERVVTYGDIEVEIMNLNLSESILGQEYSAKITSQGFSHVVNILQLMNWGNDYECPADISILENVSSYILKTANCQEPLVICCRDGVTSCGLVVGAVAVVNRLQVYQELNIYNSALTIKKYRPEFIVSKKQFEALYNVALWYLQKNSIYQNFQ